MSKIIKHRLDKLPKQDKTDWRRVDSFSDHQLVENAKIDPDAFIADDSFWESAEYVEPVPHKERITMYVDDDILTWFRGMGPRYQTRINIVLRTYMRSRKQMKTKKQAHDKRQAGQ